MIQAASLSLPPVVEVDPDKCVNCHACIAACPVKHCNDGSGNHVTVDHDMCIACGQCVRACTHEARRIRDDSEAFFADLQRGIPIVAVVAPAVAAVFPGDWLRFNGWLKSIGVRAVFDVSFGAELTIKSYLDHIQRNQPRCVIAQPCPAIVSYIEIYRPELLPYLAPADSPMLHTAKMVRRFYEQYRGHRIAVMSPCGAKKREFAETGIGDYNVTFNACVAWFKRQGRSVRDFPEVDYDNPPAERAVLFSTPGGLLETAKRWNPEVGHVTRKIEGPHVMYHYLDHLGEAVSRGEAPLLIDCLNCELGCNGGPGTPNQGASPDRVEHAVAQRCKAMQER
ncbi:MAG: 4Fe-4S binding protein, partial [Planctomycetota bacterium]|nr:4Fe-4S binding protein [Planctomycetota bacterium]